MDAGSLHAKESIPSCTAANGGFMRPDLHVAPRILAGARSKIRDVLQDSEAD